MHSHHSHSGDYVCHARDGLEVVVATAASKGFKIFCLTEHMPRTKEKFLYPEELEKGCTVADLEENFSKYLDHAYAIQQRYRTNLDMRILVGFEVEGIDDEHIAKAASLFKQDPRINMCVGSVHYVNRIPIDFDRESWVKARDSIPGQTTRALYHAYFELQYKVLVQVKPMVVGHFDLIRLFQKPDEVDPTTGLVEDEIVLATDWPEVWELVIRNIQFAAEYGALFEINSAAIHKGWLTPFPKNDISMAIQMYGGSRFCLSDDSHGVDQVGLNYHKTWDYIKRVLKLDRIFSLNIDDVNTIVVELRLVQELGELPFWNQFEYIVAN